MAGFGRLANHPFWNRTRPFIVAAAHLHIAGPESVPQVLPCVHNRTEGISPQPQLKPSSEFLTGLVFFPMLDLKLHGFDIFRHGAGGTVFHELRLVQVVLSCVFVLWLADGHEVLIEFTA